MHWLQINPTLSCEMTGWYDCTTLLTFFLLWRTQSSRYAEVLVVECLEWCHPQTAAIWFWTLNSKRYYKHRPIYFVFLPFFFHFSDRIFTVSVNITRKFGFLYRLLCFSLYVWGAWAEGGVLLRYPWRESISNSPVIQQELYWMSIIDVLEANKCHKFL